MTITTTKLTRAAGLAAIVAGFLYILVQFIHPHEEPANVATTGSAVTHILTLLMALLAMIGISGMYLRQVRQTGVLGLAGVILFAAISCSSSPGLLPKPRSCRYWSIWCRNSSMTSSGSPPAEPLSVTSGA